MQMREEEIDSEIVKRVRLKLKYEIGGIYLVRGWFCRSGKYYEIQIVQKSIKKLLEIIFGRFIDRMIALESLDAALRFC